MLLSHWNPDNKKLKEEQLVVISRLPPKDERRNLHIYCTMTQNSQHPIKIFKLIMMEWVLKVYYDISSKSEVMDYLLRLIKEFQ